MVKVRKHMVPKSIADKVTYGGSFKKTHIVIHETASTGKGAGADAHARLQANGNSRQASWNYQVDDKEVVQSFPDTAGCWHASNATYNRNSIGIEICVNSDSNYKKAVQNAADLTKSLMKKHNIPAKNVIQHYTASGGKNCPAQMRSGNYGITWGAFKKAIESSSGKVSAGKASGGSSGSSGGTSYKQVGDKWTGQVLRVYDKGGAVKDLQKLIGEKADGYFGPSTKKKVIAAQKKAGIAADGTPGKESFKAFTGNKAKSSSSSSSSGKINVDGKWGKGTTRELQKALGTTADSVFSSQPRNSVTASFYGGITYGSNGSPAVKALQKQIGANADGKLGPDTIKKLQAYLGTPVDGVISKPSSVVVKELQKQLNDGTFMKGKKKSSSKSSGSSKKSSNMSVDGKWGEDVTEGLQKVFGTPVDKKLSGQSSNAVTKAMYGNTVQIGKGGSVVIKAMQKKLGITADGLMGPSSVRALQKRMGTPVDGKLSKVSPMVKELQRRLNKGTF